MKIKMKKYLGIFAACVLLVAALYNSVYFEKLDAKKEKESLKAFNPKDKVEYFWNLKRDEVLESAIDLKAFDSQLQENPEKLIRQYGKSIGITSTFSFLVKGIATQRKSESGEIPVEISNSFADYNLQLKFIFGNAARDATGYFNIDDFENTMDFNAVATELNRLIKEREIAKLDSITPGKTIKFFGALEINSENIPKRVEIIPLKFEVAQ
jgi:predicted lipoprotein